jgi:hypothetical protein
MALYSNYPLDSTRYLQIESTNRNRLLYPYATDFDILLPNKSAVVEEKWKTAVDPIYNSYPIEFGYFGSCSNNPGNYPYGLQLSELSSNSSNFYSDMIVQDETVYPRNFADIISYDATTQTTGFSKSVITSGWKKPITTKTGLPGQPGSLYSIRKEPPLAQGSCWIMPSPYQVNLVNTGVLAVTIKTPGTGCTSFENDYNTNIDYNASQVIFTQSISPFCGVGVCPLNKSTGQLTNVLMSGYKNGNAVMWKPNTRFFIGNIIYITVGSTTHYFTVFQEGVTGNVIILPNTVGEIINDPPSGTGAKYTYQGVRYPVVKKWLPYTHYDLGDLMKFSTSVFVIMGTTGTGMSGVDITMGPLNTMGVTGELSLKSIAWYSTDPGFGCQFGGNTFVTFNWKPRTYMAEGTIGKSGAFNFCVYKAGISGDTAPDLFPFPAQVFQDGTAYLYCYPLPSGVVDTERFVGMGFPFGYDNPDTVVYVGQMFSSYDFDLTPLVSVPSNFLCVKEGTMGITGDLQYNDVTQLYNWNTGTALFKLVGIQPETNDVVFTPFAPKINNPNPSTRYNILPWEPNTFYNMGEYIYYGLLTFEAINEGTTSSTPPTSDYNQENGTIILVLIPYKDPYKGCLLKITQTEDSDNTFAPYYSKIISYNQNTNIVTLETPLPVTEKRCLYEILSFSYDNFNPLQYTLSPFFSNISTPMIFYDITLVSLTLPNLPVYSADSINVLTSAQSQPFDSYPKVGSFPFLVVTLRNTQNSNQAIPICSNNPSEYKATFRMPVTDANPNLTAPFTRLFGSETVTMRLDPNDSLRMTIADPDGNVLVFANPLYLNEFLDFVKNNIIYPDTIHYINGNYQGFGLGWVFGSVLPIPPSPNEQVSATFAIRPKIT